MTKQPGVSRRALLKAAGLSFAASGFPSDFWAAWANNARPTPIGAVDFRHSPPWWQTSICLPDDPDKTLVGKEGQLLFDWGVRPDKARGSFVATMGEDVSSFATVLQPSVVGGVQWVRQAMQSSRVPIMQTWRKASGIEISECTFIVTADQDQAKAFPRLARVDFPGFRVHGWAKPMRPSSRAMSGAAIGGSLREAPIHFKLAVDPGATMSVVYGLCEGSCKNPGERVLVLSADGAAAQSVDPVKDFGTNRPGLYKLVARDTNHDGVIDIYVGTPDSLRGQQSVLNALWVFSETVPADEDILAGRAEGQAFANFPAIVEPTRRAVVLMTLENAGAVTAECQPTLNIRGVHPVIIDGAGVVHVGSETRISGSAPLTLVSSEMAGEFGAQMPAVTLAPGEVRKVVFTVGRHFAGAAHALSEDQAREQLSAAQQWWEHYDLPYGVITVPDRGIQDMLDSCVRNIWQARELKVGGPSFQVGPTCYRGLWIADGAFLLEAAAMLGRGLEARHGVEYLLSQQKADGSFEIIHRYWKENGFVLWATTRHALLTQDKMWLRRY